QVIVTPGLYKSRVAGSPDFTILSGRTMESLLLTFYRLRDRMHSAISAEQSWARSSTAEQWPFKPLVLGSNPSALTLSSLDCSAKRSRGFLPKTASRRFFYFRSFREREIPAPQCVTASKRWSIISTIFFTGFFPESNSCPRPARHPDRI